MVTDETLKKVMQIADILKGTAIRDVLTILSSQFVFTLLQIWAYNNDLAEKEMRNYFNYINETFHEMITEHEENLKKYI